MALKSHKLIYILTLITGLTFPLQVIFNDYRIFLLPFFMSLLLFNSKRIKTILNTPLNISNLFILIILVFLILQSFFQIIITPTNTLNFVPLIIFIYCFFLFFYFNILATKIDIDYFLKAIILLGYISAIFFIYDLIYKIIYLEPTFYSKKAQIYQELRSGEVDITSRALIDYRSAGLYDKAPVSAAFVAFSLYYHKLNLGFKKNIYNYLMFFALLLTFIFILNFTGFIAFLLSSIFIFISTNKFNFNINFILNFIKIIITIFLFLILLNLLINNILPESYLKVIEFYKDYFFGTNNSVEDSAINSLKQVLYLTFNDNTNLLALLIGDGYPGGYYNSYRKGGDYGFLDNIIGLSFILYSTLFYFIFYLCFRTNKNLRIYNFRNTSKTIYINYFIFIILYIIMNDIHYSILFFKSIAPFFFISIAIIIKLLTKDFNYNKYGE
jgi:hypothetical protein